MTGRRFANAMAHRRRDPSAIPVGRSTRWSAFERERAAPARVGRENASGEREPCGDTAEPTPRTERLCTTAWARHRDVNRSIAGKRSMTARNGKTRPEQVGRVSP